MKQGHVRRRCPKPLAPTCEKNRCPHAYEYRFSHGGRVYTGSGKTERETHRAMRQAMVQADAGTLLSARERKAAEAKAQREAADRVTVAMYLPLWLKRRKKLRPSTRDSYATIIREHITPRIGDVPIADLTPRHIRDLLEELARPNERGKVRTKATLSRVRSLLSGALQLAVEDGDLQVNVARGVRLPESAAEGRAGQVTYFRPDELAIFLRQADETGKPFAPILRFIAATGVRRAEAVGLQWDAVDLEAGEVGIRRAITQRGGELRVGAPKTRKGERTIALDAETVEWLRQYRKQQAEERMRWGRSTWNPDNLVFIRSDGTPIRPDSLSHAVPRLCREAGLPRRHLHELRHSYGAFALAAGVDVKVVADQMGHSDVSLTRNVYQHTSRELAAEAARRIAAVRGSVASAVASDSSEG